MSTAEGTSFKNCLMAKRSADFLNVSLPDFAQVHTLRVSIVLRVGCRCAHFQFLK